MYAGIKFRRRREAFASHADSFLQRLLFQHGRGAIGEALQMVADGLLCTRIKFTIHIQPDFFPPFAVCHFTPTVFLPPSVSTMCSRTCFLALASRDITVPIGMSSASAI